MPIFSVSKSLCYCKSVCHIECLHLQTWFQLMRGDAPSISRCPLLPTNTGNSPDPGTKNQKYSIGCLDLILQWTTALQTPSSTFAGYFCVSIWPVCLISRSITWHCLMHRKIDSPGTILLHKRNQSTSDLESNIDPTISTGSVSRPEQILEGQTWLVCNITVLDL